MICYVYRSNRKQGTYLYILEKDDFSSLPDTVIKIFGPPEYSLSFDIIKDKKLAQADANEVIKKLETEGFYLQLPKSDYDLTQIEQDIVNSIKKEP